MTLFEVSESKQWWIALQQNVCWQLAHRFTKLWKQIFTISNILSVWLIYSFTFVRKLLTFKWSHKIFISIKNLPSCLRHSGSTHWVVAPSVDDIQRVCLTMAHLPRTDGKTFTWMWRVIHVDCEDRILWCHAVGAERGWNHQDFNSFKPKRKSKSSHF